MYWQASYDQRGTWHWTSGEFENGWVAQVVDASQTHTPARETEYHAQAVGTAHIKEWPNAFSTLEDAKHAAIGLALAQVATVRRAA